MNLSWTLARYARFQADRRSAVVRNENNFQKGLWKNWSTSNGDFNLSLSETGQLIVTQGDICLENILLSSSRDKLKILAKGDSMLFAVKLKNDVRRFRIMFAEIGSKSLSSEQACIECSAAMKSYFPVRTVKQDGRSVAKDTDPATSQTPVSLADHPQKNIEGTVSLHKLMELLTSGDPKRLPCAYQVGSSTSPPPNLETDAFGRLVKWCLLDPEFPAFVQQVETELKRISEEC